jgi:ABC-type uncharacterized transport system substrate-binding protein
VKRPARISVTYLVAILLIVSTESTPAHPHVYVVYSVVLPLGPRGLDGVGFVFTFDELFSTVILQEAGRGDPATVARNHARSLRQIPYEIEVTFNGVPVPTDEPTDLRVTTEGGQVTYRFVVPLKAPLLPPGTIDVKVDDPGFFTAFVLRPSVPVEVKPSGAFTATCERARMPTGAPGPIRCQYARTR